jgi:hypothetical protein
MPVAIKKLHKTAGASNTYLNTRFEHWKFFLKALPHETGLSVYWLELIPIWESGG